MDFYTESLETEMSALQNKKCKTYNFTLTVSSITAMIFAVWDWDDRCRLLPAVLLIERLCATFVECRPMFVFLVFITVFLCESMGRKSFRFPQILIKILSAYSHIPFHCIVITHKVTQ